MKQYQQLDIFFFPLRKRFRSQRAKALASERILLDNISTSVYIIVFTIPFSIKNNLEKERKNAGRSERARASARKSSSSSPP